MDITLPMIADGEDKSSPFKNKIRKNYRHVRKWAKRTLTNCFRIYDREIPNYQLAIDFYDGRFCVHYFSRYRDEPGPPEELIEETEKALFDIFKVGPDHIFWRNRARRRKTDQYEKRSEEEEFFTVIEYGAQFIVNLVDYLDTGLFLDHREMRKLVASYCKDKRVLNLFAYTCSFSIHAALQGASFTKSVDMSNTYTTWGQENFLLNNIPLDRHQVVRADCLKFLEGEKEKYDIIILDPPTISRSKKMDQMFDIQEDYIDLLKKSLHLLAPKGILFFSTNSRKFKLDKSLFSEYEFIDISKKTLPLDFHDPKIHQCWKIVAL